MKSKMIKARAKRAEQKSKHEIDTLEFSLDRIASLIHANAIKHEFHNFDEADTVFMNRELMNLIGEAAEIRDSERDDTLWLECDKADKMRELGLEPLLSIEEEYADIIIRALDQMQRLIGNKPNARSIGNIILTKMFFNQSRPIKHGRVTA